MQSEFDRGVDVDVDVDVGVDRDGDRDRDRDREKSPPASSDNVTTNHRYAITKTIPALSAGGQWKVQYVEVEDMHGNTRRYVAETFPEGDPKSSRPGYDFRNTWGFQVISGDCESFARRERGREMNDEARHRESRLTD